MLYIVSEENEADVLTKCLTGKPFGCALTLLGLENTSDFISSITSGSSTPSFSPNLDTSVSEYVDAHE